MYFTIICPVQAVDSFAARQLTKLEEKVPAIKSEPAEVVTYLTESKDAITTKISDGSTAVRTRLSEGKEAITSRVTAGKDAVVSTIHSGAETLSQTRVAVLASEGKDVVVAKLSEGKDAVSTRLVQGKDALYSTVQSGVSAVANTRAGALVGSGVDHTLHATEKVIDYLLPAEENEKELLSEAAKEKEPVELTTLGSTTESTVPDEVEEEVSPQTNSFDALDSSVLDIVESELVDDPAEERNDGEAIEEDTEDAEALVDTFLEFTGSSDRELAAAYLRATNSDLEQAMDLFQLPLSRLRMIHVTQRKRRVMRLLLAEVEG